MNYIANKKAIFQLPYAASSSPALAPVLYAALARQRLDRLCNLVKCVCACVQFNHVKL